MFFNLNLLKAEHNGYPALGLLTFIIGLPTWLMGCWLAENYQNFKLVSINRIQTYRIFMVVIFLLLHIIKFHGPTVFSSNCFTLNLFSILATHWLGSEIRFYMSNKPNFFLEYFGKFSYSLYLIHPIVPSIILFLNLGTFINLQFFIIPISLVISYIFYLIIEKPSHLLAIKISNLFQ